MRHAAMLLLLAPLAACASTGAANTSIAGPAAAPALRESTPVPVPQRNDRVRVALPATATQPERFVAGHLLRLSADTVILARGMVLDTLTLAEGRRLQAVVRSSGHTWSGVRYGALGGGILGGAIGAATWTPCTDTGWFACFMYPSQGAQIAGGAALGALLGGLVGGAIGAGHRTEEWGTVAIAGTQVSLRPNGIGLRYSF